LGLQASKEQKSTKETLMVRLGRILEADGLCLKVRGLGGQIIIRFKRLHRNEKDLYCYNSSSMIGSKRKRKGEISMSKGYGTITMKGNPLDIAGKELKSGDQAPDVELVDNGLLPVKLSSFRGKVCIVSAVPSLDTPVCDMETRRFNEEAGNLGSNVVILTVSTDLPFAQKRWCGAAGVDKVITLSDHRETAFGQAYGVLIKGLRLLARAIFIIDRDGVVRYVQVVNEVTNEPDYDAVLAAAKKLI
jgi:thiol peroxidase